MSRHTHLSADHSMESKPRPTWEVIRRVSTYLRPYKGMFAATLGCAVLSLAFSFVFPKMTQIVVDEVIDKGRAEILASSMLALIAAFFFSDLFNSLRIRINN